MESKRILGGLLPADLNTGLMELISLTEDKFVVSDDLWAESIFNLLMVYNFEDEQKQVQVITVLTALYNARIAGYTLEMQAFSKNIDHMEDKNELLIHQMESMRQRLNNTFWCLKPGFSSKWTEKSEQIKPPLVPLGYMEYVPGKPIVIPKKMAGKDKSIVSTDDVFKSLRKRYEESQPDGERSACKSKLDHSNDTQTEEY
jgi:hypothetical protein